MRERENTHNDPGNPLAGILPIAVVAIVYDQFALGGQYTALLVEKYQQVNTWLNTAVTQPQTVVAGNSVAGAGAFTPWQLLNLAIIAIVVIGLGAAVARSRGTRRVDSKVASVAVTGDEEKMAVRDKQRSVSRTAIRKHITEA